MKNKKIEGKEFHDKLLKDIPVKSVFNKVVDSANESGRSVSKEMIYLIKKGLGAK